MNRLFNLKLVSLIVIGFTTLVLLMIGAGLGKAQSNANDIAPASVSVQAVALQSSYRYAQRVLSRVETINTSAAGFDIGGLVTSLNVDEGSQVQPGMLLANLDTDRLRARQNELKSALNRAQAEQRLAGLTQKRMQSLVEQGLESSQILDEATASFDVAKAAVAQVQAQLASLDVELQRSQLTAPFAATVVQRHVDPGVSVAAGQPILTLQSDSDLELRASLPANLVKTLQPGDTVAFASGEHTATLDRFVTAQNTQTRTQDALFKVDAQNWQGLSGEIINLVVPVDKTAIGMWVPLSALSGGIRGMWTVYVVENKPEPTIIPRIVEIIYTDGQRAYISGALENGDKLVFEGTQRLVPGQIVSVVEG